ncbi:hypothetical protein ONZ45_g4772 [Pleurotus djamor]|nr:hypothetical protein ONZ45_g4772 [Pleurotus djamor]
MAFVLANPPSPSARTRPLPERDHDAEWALSSPFRAVPFHSSSATTTTPSSSSSAAFPSDTTAHHPHVMSKEKDRQRLEISLDTDCLYLKGTGADVEPALLSGHVILHLAESTSIKEITLQFRGKARLPVSPSESCVLDQCLAYQGADNDSVRISLNNSPNSFLLCHHQWSFLEGEKKHSHRLKAGRHIFPFQLQIGGSLPSSISTQASGGAAIIYKLRANLVRPGFSFAHSALQAVIPIYVVRAFSSEALEYQQTLEIENTWPEKLMYSIMLPHKAWAAGDKVVALAKFSPLAKGVRIISITSTVHETTKIYSAKGVYQESTHPVASVMHEMVGGVAHEVTRDELRRRRSASFGRSPSGAASPAGLGTRTPPQSHTPTPSTSSSAPMFSMTPLADPSSSSSSSSAHSSPRPAMLPLASTATSTYTPSINPDETIETMDEMSTLLHIPIPPNTTTPTHSLDPIVVSHRLRWSILIHNLDGHTSELRCSLPIHVLDPRLLGEARQFTAVTRRFLLGDHHHHQHDYDDGYGGGGETMNDEDAELLMDNEEDLELPSYYSHVRDRVANMFLPEGATMRVTNPWVLHGVSPVIANNLTATTTTNGYGTTVHGGRSGYASPSPYGYDTPHRVNTLGGASVGVPSPLSQLPSAPRAGETTPLDWVNSELLLSLSNPSNPSSTAANQAVSTSAPVPRNAIQPQGFGSRFSTRPNTRPPSPERERGDRLQASSRSSSFTNLVGALGHLSLISHAHGNNNQVHGGGGGGENSNSESNSNSNSNSTTNLPATAPSNSNPPSHSHSHSNSNSNIPSSNPPAATNASSAAPAPASNPNPTSFTPSTTTTSNPNETYIHSSSSTRQTPSLTSISMKVLAHHSWLPSRSGSFTNLSGLGGGAGGGIYGGGGVVNGTGDVGHTHMSLPFRHGQGQGQIPYSSSHPSLLSMAMTPSSTVTPPTAGSATPPLSLPHSQSQHTHTPISSIPLPDPELGSVLLHRAFTEVPDYSVASRGFLGGVPPLSSMQGLPSYEEAAASASVAGTGATRDDGEDGEGGSSSSSS